MKRPVHMTAGVLALAALFLLSARGGYQTVQAQTPATVRTSVPVAATPVFVPARTATATPVPFSASASPTPTPFVPTSVATPIPASVTTPVPASVPLVTPSPAVPPALPTPPPPGFVPAVSVPALPGPTSSPVSAPGGSQAGQVELSDTPIGALVLDFAGGLSSSTLSSNGTMGPVQIYAFSGGFGPSPVTSAGAASLQSLTSQPVEVAKLIDSVSPRLLELALKGTVIPAVQILLCKQGSACTATSSYATYTLTRAKVTELRHGNDTIGDVLVERVTLSYEQIKLSTPGTGRIELCFNMTTSSVC